MERKVFYVLVILLIVIIFIGNSSIFALEIRTASQESHPKYILEEINGKKVMTGICIDIMNAITERYPEVKFTGTDFFTPFRRIEILLELGQYDVFFGMIKNEARKEKYIFLKETPLYPTRNMIAVRADDDIDVSSFDEIRKLGEDGLLLVASGTAHYRYLSKQGGLVIDQGGKTVEDNMLKLLANRGRFVYSSDKNFMIELQRPEFKGKIRILPTVFNEEYQYAAFSKKADKEKIEIVDKALRELEKEGELTRIFEKYIHFD